MTQEWLAKVLWDAGASVRNNPNTSGTPLDTLVKGSEFRIDAVVPDSVSPSTQKLWGRISSNNVKYVGKYVALLYPSSGGNFVRCEWNLISDVPEPPPSGEVVLTHTIEVYSDGSIKIDGQPYP